MCVLLMKPHLRTKKGKKKKTFFLPYTWLGWNAFPQLCRKGHPHHSSRSLDFAPSVSEGERPCLVSPVAGHHPQGGWAQSDALQPHSKLPFIYKDSTHWSPHFPLSHPRLIHSKFCLTSRTRPRSACFSSLPALLWSTPPQCLVRITARPPSWALVMPLVPTV